MKRVKQNITREGNGVVASLTWMEQIMALSREARKRQVMRVLEGLKTIGSLDDRESAAGRELHALLSSREVDLVGFIPNVVYIRADGKEDLDVGFVHPFSMPSLLFAHRKTGVLMIVNPYLKFNDVSIGAIPMNRDQIDRYIRGIAG